MAWMDMRKWKWRADLTAFRIAACLSHFHPMVGGSERQLFQLARCWARWGHQPLILTRRVAGLPACEVIDGVEIRRAIGTMSLGPLFGLSFLGSLSTRLLRMSRRYDVLLAAQAPWEAVAAGLVAPRLGKPSVVRLASVGRLGDAAQLAGAKGSRLWQRLALHNTRFVAPSEQARLELLGLGCPAERIESIPNGVDCRQFAPAWELEPATEGLAAGETATPHPGGPAETAGEGGAHADRERTVIFVGRLTAVKNPLAVLRAWKRLNPKIHHAGTQGRYRLLMVGDGPLATSLASYARQESLRSVEFLGRCDDMPPLYRRAAVCVQPSPSEGCSNALLEAMASGLCPVVTRVPGNVDLVDEGINGLTVPLDDDDALAEALARVLDDAPLRRRLASAARQRVLERHDLERVAHRYVELFAELLKEKDEGKEGKERMKDKETAPATRHDPGLDRESSGGGESNA